LKALIVADGDVPSRSALDRLLRFAAADVVVAADGGALKAEALGLHVDVLVGDSDSISSADAERFRTAGTEVIVHPAAKNESDTQLALLEARRRGADSIVVIGAFGGSRLEHTVANLLLLALPDLVGADVVLADGASEVRLLDAGRTLALDGQRGDFLSLLPLAPMCAGVTTAGLEYPLKDEALPQGPARGLSNVFTGERATVSLRSGRLLVIHTRHDQ
jgi:thiamine pyrophosphokinase